MKQLVGLPKHTEEYVVNMVTAPNAVASINKESPKNTPKTAIQPIRFPCCAASASTYREFGPGSKIINTAPNT